MYSKNNILATAILSIMLIAFAGCSGNNKHDREVTEGDSICGDYSSVRITDLSEMVADTIVTFKEEYPATLYVVDSLLTVIHVQNDSCLLLCNANTGEIIHKTGSIGEGPNEFQFAPDILADEYAYTETHPGKLLLYDINKVKFAELDCATGEYEMINVPETLTNHTSLNIQGDIAVSKNTSDPFSIMQISHVANNVTTQIKYPEVPSPDIVPDQLQLNYLMSVNVAANFKKDRIIVPLFFFDCYYVFDMNGSLLKSICLGAEEFDMTQAAIENRDGNGFIGYNQAFATADNCYLQRWLKLKKQGEKSRKQLVKIDWDGNPQHIYTLPEGVSGRGNCIDGDYLYCIVNPQNDDIEDDNFYILRYKL